jgi:hypothetical protein
MESVPVYKDREVIGTIELTNIRYPFDYNMVEAKIMIVVVIATVTIIQFL